MNERIDIVPIVWDWKDQPDAGEITTVVAAGYRYFVEINTRTDQMVWIASRVELTEARATYEFNVQYNIPER